MVEDLRAVAVRRLARREHTRSELRQRLLHDGGPADAVEAVLDELAARGLLSDARYAGERVARRGRGLGNARLEHELRSRGVAADQIAAAISLAGDEVVRAREARQRKFGERPANRDEWLRQARFLQSRGFSADTVRQVLKEAGDE